MKKNGKEARAKKRPDGRAKLPANARSFPIARDTYDRILKALQEQQQAAMIHNQKSAEAAGYAQTVADERGLGPIQLHSVDQKDGKCRMTFLPKRGRFDAPDHVRRGRAR